MGMLPQWCAGIVVALLMAAPGDASGDSARPDVTSMKMSQIRAHNAKLDKGHRYFILCRTDTITGSLSKRARTCRTREDWDRMANQAQEHLTEIIDKSFQLPVPPPE